MYYIYGKPYCKWCIAAKELLDRYGIEYIYYEIVDDTRIIYDKNKIDSDNHKITISRSDFINMYPNIKTVPLVFQGPIQIGGFAELKAWL